MRNYIEGSNHITYNPLTVDEGLLCLKVAYCDEDWTGYFNIASWLVQKLGSVRAVFEYVWIQRRLDLVSRGEM